MSDIENPISTDKSSVFDYKQYEANELNYWYLRDEWLAEWRENLIKLRAQYEAIELNYSYLGEERLAEWRENLIKLRAPFQD